MDEQRALRVARRMRAGQVDVNGGAFNLRAPFGGYKQSGHGRENGRAGIEEYPGVQGAAVQAGTESLRVSGDIASTEPSREEIGRWQEMPCRKMSLI